MSFSREISSNSYSIESMILSLSLIEALANSHPQTKVGTLLSITMRLATLGATASLFSKLSLNDDRAHARRQQSLFYYLYTPTSPGCSSDEQALLSYKRL